MGLTRDFCFFIVVEQIILSNIQLVRSISSFTASGFGHSNAIVWAQMPTGFIQILVSIILVQGLLERKTGKFIPWIIVNALGCLVISVATIVVLFDPSVIQQIFEMNGSNSIIYIVLLMITVLQWVIWITVIVYYRHLKLKDIERKMNAEKIEKGENDENSTDEPAFIQYPKMFDNQVQLRNVHYNQHEVEEQIPLNKMYPVPTAPDL